MLNQQHNKTRWLIIYDSIFQIYLRMNNYKFNHQKDHFKTVIVGNLPFDIEEEVRKTFEETFGQINYVRVIKDPQRHVGKGFGHVFFNELQSLKKALWHKLLIQKVGKQELRKLLKQLKEKQRNQIILKMLLRGFNKNNKYLQKEKEQEITHKTNKKNNSFVFKYIKRLIKLTKEIQSNGNKSVNQQYQNIKKNISQRYQHFQPVLSFNCIKNYIKFKCLHVEFFTHNLSIKQMKLIF